MNSTHDNIWLFTDKKYGYNEYFAVAICDGNHGGVDIHIYRYCVPGRCDTYNFKRNTKTLYLSYFSEGCGLSESMKIVQRDLNKKKVVDFLLKFFSVKENYCYLHMACEQIVGEVAPKSLAYREMRKEVVKRREERLNRIKS